MKNHIDIGLEIQFKTPFHSGTGLSAGLIDRGAMRDSEGLLYIPASTFKGVLRNRVEDIVDILELTEVAGVDNLPPNDHDDLRLLRYFHSNHKLTPIERIFGSVVNPGNLFVENFVMVNSDRIFFETGDNKKYDPFLQTESRTQTRIYRSLQTVKQGALFQSEYGLKDLRFKGRIYGFISGTPCVLFEHPKIKSISYEIFFLLMGLKLIDKIAGNKSTGMGQFDYTDIKLNIDNIVIDDVEELFHDSFFTAISLYKDAMESDEAI